MILQNILLPSTWISLTSDLHTQLPDEQEPQILIDPLWTHYLSLSCSLSIPMLVISNPMCEVPPKVTNVGTILDLPPSFTHPPIQYLLHFTFSNLFIIPIGLCCVSVLFPFKLLPKFPYWNPFKCDYLKPTPLSGQKPTKSFKNANILYSNLCLKFFNEFLHYSGEHLKSWVYKRRVSCCFFKLYTSVKYEVLYTSRRL